MLRMIELVLADKAATKEEVLEMDRRIQEQVAQAVAAALAAPFPPAEDAFAHVYAGGDLWPK